MYYLIAYLIGLLTLPIILSIWWIPRILYPSNALAKACKSRLDAIKNQNLSIVEVPLFEIIGHLLYWFYVVRVFIYSFSTFYMLFIRTAIVNLIKHHDKIYENPMFKDGETAKIMLNIESEREKVS